MKYTVEQSRDAIGEYLLIVQELLNDIQQDEAKILSGVSGPGRVASRVNKRSVREEFANAKIGLKEAVRALKSADRIMMEDRRLSF